MLESIGLECDQPAALRQHIDARTAAGVQAKLATVIGDPAVIQVQRRRDGAHVAAHEAVEVPRIAGAARIQREVTLEIFEAGHERAVEHGAQLLEPREYALFGIALGLLQPGNEIAADFGHVLRVVATPDPRRLEATGLVQFDAALTQLGEQLRVDEVVSNTVTAFGELIDQARRRDRSPRRFASGRWVLRAFPGLRRFAAGLATFFFGAAFFGAASSMEPRHFGEPQRQA